MPFTAYADNKLIDHLLGSGTYTKPAALYLALFVGDPQTTGAEVTTSGSAYGRLAATFTISGGTATNASAIEYSAATTVWGVIDYCAVYDDETGGNMLVSAPLTASKDIQIGDILRFQSGSLSVTLS